nr:hypothetical protein CFP56_16820 [Quercus suber]
MSSQGTPSPTRNKRLNVYKVRYRLAMQDPDMPSPRYHTVIFVETEADFSGFVHHVTGDLVSQGGMRYERKRGNRPEESGTFFNKELLGTVLSSQYPMTFDRVCAAQPAPPRQKAFNIETRRTEPIKPDGTFYSSGEPRQPLIKCTEWTELQAIPALRQAGLIS